MAGKYHDLIGLIEFGDEAYVVTPFTTDYENILLSTDADRRLDRVHEVPRSGHDASRWRSSRATGLFKAFDFLDAAGNLMLLFTDGQDTQVTIHGKNVNEIVAGAVQSEDPGVHDPHQLQQGARRACCPTTSGSRRSNRPAASSTRHRTRGAIIIAIHDIDRRSAGRVDIKRYGSGSSRSSRRTRSWRRVAGPSRSLLQLTVPVFPESFSACSAGLQGMKSVIGPFVIAIAAARWPAARSGLAGHTERRLADVHQQLAAAALRRRA
mgnify:CR=1 FL=1